MAAAESLTSATVALSVVVVAHDMARELPRTLRTLSAPYQRGIDSTAFEVIVVDNGSPEPLVLPPSAEERLRVHRIEQASPSPALAANVGIDMARGALIGLVVDGARMASPGLLATALRGEAAAARAVVTAPAWHLGRERQSGGSGHTQAIEDELLEGAGWEADGYRLFAVATPAASSARGLFGAMGESSSLFLRRELWQELGGLDERFALPGGGMVNHDLYRRACQLADAQLVVLLGEGTFHQVHGGAATSGRLSREEMRADYEAICGAPHRPPGNRPLFVGTVSPDYLPHVTASVALAQAAAGRSGPAGQIGSSSA